MRLHKFNVHLEVVIRVRAKDKSEAKALAKQAIDQGIDETAVRDELPSDEPAVERAGIERTLKTVIL